MWLALIRFVVNRLLPGLILAEFCICPGVAAQSGWLDQSWQTDEGLPDNGVTGVAQTPDGYLWVASLGGLVRFDGAKFEEFSPLNLAGIPNRVVRAMFLDRSNRLWLATDHGPVVCVSSNTAQMFTSGDGLPNLRVTAMAQDMEGTVWLACGSMLCRIKDWKVIQMGAADGVPTGGGLWIGADAQGELWCVKGGELGRFRGGRFQKAVALDNPASRFTAAAGGGLWVCAGIRLFRLVEPGELHELARLPEGAQPRVMLEDRAGALWIGTAAHGLFRCEGGQVERVHTSHPEISCLTQDREGNIWVGTVGGGINRVRARVIELLGTAEGLPSESMRSVSEAADGSVWVVTQSGLLACGDGHAWTNVPAAGAWSGRHATCVATARDGAVWIGTGDQGLLELRGGRFRVWGAAEGLSAGAVRSILASSKGDVWVATDSPSRVHQLRAGKMHPFELSPAARSIRALVEDAAGTVWIGTSDGQVLRVQEREFRSLSAIQESRRPSVRYLQATADGSLWIGYAGWGLGRYKAGEYARLTVSAGLKDDYVSQILPDRHGRLWISSNRGIFQVRIQDLAEVAEGSADLVRSVVFGPSEGVRSLQANCDYFPSACVGSGGRLWFCLRSGLAVVYADKLVDSLQPPPVVLDRVRVDDRAVALHDSRSPLRAPSHRPMLELGDSGGRLDLPAAHRKLEFDFAALSFASPENVSFRYCLKNFDPDWIEAGAQRSATYPRLPAGSYEFRVQACENGGAWSERGGRLELEVMPFFWQEWWFRLGMLTLFTASIIGVVRYFSYRRLRRELERLEELAALHKERARIARDMHDEVGSKLSRLSLLSEMASQQPDMPASARGEVAEISETARDTIRSFEEIVWAVNPKNDSLANLVQYLSRFAEEFFEGSATQCAFELPEDIPALALPTEVRHHVFLAAKEALNNVLKHAGAGRVCVRVTMTDDGFEIGIEDDGCGFAGGEAPPRSGSGNGLDNMRERMRAVGGQFALQSHPGKGTQVSFLVPCPPRPAS